MQSRYLRASFVALLVGSIVAATVGFPVFHRPEKDLSAPFPCQDRACGCNSAAACWAHCCCHTNAEKVAWAKQRGIEPPEFVVEAARTEEGVKTCACCTAQPSSAKHAASCQSSDPQSVPNEADALATDGLLKVRFVLTEDFRRCQGLSTLWIVWSHAALVNDAPLLVAAFEPTGWLQIRSEFGELAVREPLLPPPKSRAL